MAERKAWTKPTRRAAAQKGVRTRQARAAIIEQARTDRNTQWALLFPFAAWLEDSIKLKERVAQTLRLSQGANRTFRVPEGVAGLVLAWEAGIVHYHHLNQLVPEVARAQAIGLPHFFGPTPATDRVKSAQPRHLKQMGRRLRAIGLAPLATDADDRIDIWVDTTGHPSDSRQGEPVAVGYGNGRREPGLKSGRVGVNGRPVFAPVYPGNINPDEPFRQGLARARRLCPRYPERIIHLGADTGFASEAHMRDLHRWAHHYGHFRFTLTVQVSHPNRFPFQTVQWAKRQDPRRWKPVNTPSRVLEAGRRPRYSTRRTRTRILVVESKNPAPPAAAPPPRKRRRKKNPQKPRAAERYYLIATHYTQRQHKGQALFHRHHQRPVVEFSIKDAKPSYRIQHLPHRKFLANALFLLLVTLAQLLGILYNQKGMPAAAAGRLVATLRADLWRLPGRRIGPRQIVLHWVYYRLEWIRAVCVAIQRHLGFSIVMAEVDSS